jgi:hypothetical protein
MINQWGSAGYSPSDWCTMSKDGVMLKSWILGWNLPNNNLPINHVTGIIVRLQVGISYKRRYHDLSLDIDPIFDRYFSVKRVILSHNGRYIYAACQYKSPKPIIKIMCWDVEECVKQLVGKRSDILKPASTIMKMICKICDTKEENYVEQYFLPIPDTDDVLYVKNSISPWKVTYLRVKSIINHENKKKNVIERLYRYSLPPHYNPYACTSQGILSVHIPEKSLPEIILTPYEQKNINNAIVCGILPRRILRDHNDYHHVITYGVEREGWLHLCNIDYVPYVDDDEESGLFAHEWISFEREVMRPSAISF